MITVDDFFKAVSQSIQSNRETAGLVVLCFLLFVMALYLYFRHFRRPVPEDAVKKSRHKASAGGANAILEDVFSGEADPKLVELKNSVNASVERYLANSLDPSAINALNSKYWLLLSYIIDRKFSSANPSELEFTRNERLVIDFGYMSNRLGASIYNFDEKAFDRVFSCKYDTDPEFRFSSVCDWLSSCLRDFIGTETLSERRKEFDGITAMIRNANAEKERNKKLRRELFDSIPSNPGVLKSTIDRITSLSEDLDRIMDIYAFFKYKNQSGSKMTREEIAEFSNIENFVINNLRNERRDTFREIQGGDRINADLVKFENEMIARECEILSLVSSKGKCKSEIDRIENGSKNATGENKAAYIKEKANYLRGIFTLIARQNQVEPVIFVTRKAPESIPDQIFRAIALFADADPAVFSSRLLKTAGYPSILFVPGCGNGIYDRETNTLVFPIMPLRDFNETAVTAMVTYRWDCDESDDLKNSFHNRKKYKKFNMNTLKTALIREYLIFVMYPQVRKRVMDKEIYDWFMSEIAPAREHHARDIPIVKLYEKGTKNVTPTERRSEARETPEQLEQKARDALNQMEKASPSEMRAYEEISEKSGGQISAASPVSAVPPVEQAGQLQASAEEPASGPWLVDPLEKYYEKASRALDCDVHGRMSVLQSDRPDSFNIVITGVSPEFFEKTIDLIVKSPALRNHLVEYFKAAGDVAAGKEK